MFICFFTMAVNSEMFLIYKLLFYLTFLVTVTANCDFFFLNVSFVYIMLLSIALSFLDFNSR